jgi:hypothetical protein
MNLHALASGAIGSINPFVIASIKVSTGYGKVGYVQNPTYAAPINVSVQVQPLTGPDLKQLDGLNLNGTKRKLYLNGSLNGTVRVAGKGGDVITLTDGPNAGVWLVVFVFEQWTDWCSVCCTLQES